MLITIFSIIIHICVFGQENLYTADNYICEGCYATCSPNPDKLLKSELCHYFTKQESEQIRKHRIITIHLVIEVNSNQILDAIVSPRDSVETKIAHKLKEMIKDNMTVMTAKATDNVPKCDTIAQGFVLRVYRMRSCKNLE
jgi:hypothetical protein